MGRKIPGKKHRTIKDPYKQMKRRQDSLKFKLNNPPSNADEQEIPKSLLRIMELKKESKKAPIKRPRRRRNKTQTQLSLEKVLDKDPIQKGMTKPDKFIPNLVQKPFESTKSFFRRVSLMTQGLINEVEFEKKFGVEIRKNPETGEVIEVKNVKKKNVKSKKKKLSEKRKEKLDLKKEDLNNVKDFNQMKDNVEFGEVVHRPPTLPSLKLKLDNEINKTKKPRYSNLLLNNVVENDQVNSKKVENNLQKERAEKERQYIVEAYRKLKKKKSGI